MFVYLQTDLHAEIESLRAQRDEASARAVAALKEAKAKEEELQKERSEKKILAERVADLERRNEELQKSANVGAAKGRSSSGGASLAGLEGDVKKEFDEVSSSLNAEAARPPLPEMRCCVCAHTACMECETGAA